MTTGRGGERETEKVSGYKISKGETEESCIKRSDIRRSSGEMELS